EDIQEFWFSRLGGKKTKASGSSTSKAKPSFSSIAKAKASILAKELVHLHLRLKLQGYHIKQSLLKALYLHQGLVHHRREERERLEVEDDFSI
ncbi:hypothetical protein Tco_0203019, partial [Tanacetum coccineum]